MDERASPQAVAKHGVRVVCDDGYAVAALRFFETTGVFAQAVAGILGTSLPGISTALIAPRAVAGADMILAWRSPTQCLALARETAAIHDLQRGTAQIHDGYVVDQTGGCCVVRLSGPRCREVLVRVGGDTAIPRVRESKPARLAELSVVCLCVRSDEYLLVVDRHYVDHLLGWLSSAVTSPRTGALGPREFVRD